MYITLGTFIINSSITLSRLSAVADTIVLDSLDWHYNKSDENWNNGYQQATSNVFKNVSNSFQLHLSGSLITYYYKFNQFLLN